MIFYGPPGTGKTTVAKIISQNCGKRLHKLNGTNASVADIKAIVGELDTLASFGGIVLYLDEIQYFNKKQQQSLLEYIENGQITLIASTTENPYFYVHGAVLSRCTVFEFRPISAAAVEKNLERAVRVLEEERGEKIEFEQGVLSYIAAASGGDARKSLNSLELCVMAAPFADGVRRISREDAQLVSQRSAMRYDRDGDEHYDILSAFHKSLRGSDENAALHYLARLLHAGDLISPARRLLCAASEDVGMAYPQAVQIVKSCVDTALQLGLPEAKLPLAQAVLTICTAPKSNSVVMAIDAAMADVQSGRAGTVPDHLRDSHYGGAQKLGHGQGYQYPHNFPHNYIKQQYLPDSVKDRVYYQPGENKNEQAFKAYWDKIK